MNNAKVTKDGNKTIIELSKNKAEKDPNYPYIKKSIEYRIENPNTLFGRYIAFYSAVQASGGSQNMITTETIMTIGLHYNLSKNIIEKSIKELVTLNELIKVKRGIYMINPRHISGGRTPEASRELINTADNIQNIQTQNNNSNNTTVVVANHALLRSILGDNFDLKNIKKIDNVEDIEEM